MSNIKIAAIIFRTSIILSMTWMSSTATEIESSFQKLPVILKAADVLSKDVLAGSNYRIAETIENDGFVNTYHIDTDYGALIIEGTGLLMIRVNELNAIDHMEKLKQTTTFKDALVAGAKAPFLAAKGLVTEPVDTVTGIGTGVGHWFSDVGQSIVSDDPHQDNALKTAIGYSATKRKFAYEYGINPYTRYEPVMKRLGEIARVSVAGGLTTKVASGFLKRPVGTALQLFSTAHTMKLLVRDNSPDVLEDINEKKLKKMGVSDSLTKTFLNNPYFDPQETTLLVGALDSMKNVNGRDSFIKEASLADEVEVALFMRLQAQMIADYHLNVAPITQFVWAQGILIQKQEGIVVNLLPLDYIAWTPAMLRKENVTSEFIKRLPGVTGKELWIAGSVDSAARRNFEERGWTVKENILNQIFKPVDSPD